MMDYHIIILLIIGLIGGYVMGITGSNAMSIYVPSLLLLGDNILTAISTCSLIQITITSTMLICLRNYLHYYKNYLLIPLILFFSFLGNRIGIYLPREILLSMTIAVLFITGLIMLFSLKNIIKNHIKVLATERPINLSSKTNTVKLYIICMLSAMSFGLFSAGGSIVIVRVLMRVMHITYIQALSICLLLVFFSLYIPILMYAPINVIDFKKYSFIVLPGMITSSIAVVLHAHKIDNYLLTKLQGAYLSIASILLILRHYHY